MSIVTSPDSELLRPETAHELLGPRLRRCLLYCLYLYANPLRLPDVAELVTEWISGAPGEENLDKRLEVYMALYHDHLPVLADADVISYCQEEDLVELGTNAPALRPYLERTLALDRERLDVPPALE